MAANEALESGGDDSDREQSPNRNILGGGDKIKKKLKKGLKKKPKKTVFRNNFVKESDSTQ